MESILIDAYKTVGHTKMTLLAKEMGFGSFIVKKLVDEYKKSMNFSLGEINRERSKKILTHEVKSDLISMRFQFGWNNALKLAKEKYGIGYKTLRRTVNEFYQNQTPQPT